MRLLAYDLLQCLGIALLAAGVYVEHGGPRACMVAGGLLVVLPIVDAVMAARRAPGSGN